MCSPTSTSLGSRVPDRTPYVLSWDDLRPSGSPILSAGRAHLVRVPLPDADGRCPPPPMPPGHHAPDASCITCPWSDCPGCRCRAAWRAWEAEQDRLHTTPQPTPTPPRRRGLLARLWRQITGGPRG